MALSVEAAVAPAAARRIDGWDAGKTAGLAGLLASALVALALGAPPPLDALAGLLIAWTPADLANLFLLVLGPFGKPLALVGAAFLVVAVSGPIGALALARPRGAVAAVLILLALAAPLVRPGTALGVGVLVAVYLISLGWLARRPAPLGRRAFLRDAARNVAVVAAVSFTPGIASMLRSRLIGRVDRPPLFAFNAPAPRAEGFDLAGLTPEVTPAGAFYRMSKNITDPLVAVDRWRLTVTGQVRTPLALSFDDLASLPRVDQFISLECVSNPVAGPLWSAALFSGVALGALLDRAGISETARWVSFGAPDGHREQLPIALARDPFLLIAYAMNGDWLDPVHGAPARLVAGGLYGFRSVKWLDSIEVLAEPKAGHWEERGWTAASIQTTARIDVARREGDLLIVAGVAFAGTRGVRAVEVRRDGGSWQPASLHAPPLSGAMWVQWRAGLPAGAGTIEVRAIDGAGVPQIASPAGQFPSGATGLHRLSIPG